MGYYISHIYCAYVCVTMCLGIIKYVCKETVLHKKLSNDSISLLNRHFSIMDGDSVYV